MDDLISVIITVYNNKESLKDCILSVISQTYRNIEIIIVDDGSTDSSSRLCDELLISNSNLKVLHELKSGIAESRNKGIRLCKGKYITFINGTDIMERNMLQILKSMMDNYNVELAMCTTKDVAKDLGQSITFDKEDALRQLLLENIVENNPYGKLFNRALFSEIQFVDKSANTLYRIIENCSKVAFMNSKLYDMNTSEEFTFNSILNKDLRIMDSYPHLSIYCKCNIIKSIQNAFYKGIINNTPIEDEENLYSLLLKTLKAKDDEIASFFDYNRRAHLYLLADDLKNYKVLCPVLKELK